MQFFFYEDHKNKWLDLSGESKCRKIKRVEE
jgi:hypothetical protein